MIITTTRLREWPSREAWARVRRTFYTDDEMPAKYFEPYHDLVTEDLRHQAVEELAALWRALGRHVRGYREEAAALLDALRRGVDDFPSPKSDVRFTRAEIRKCLAPPARRYRRTGPSQPSAFLLEHIAHTLAAVGLSDLLRDHPLSDTRRLVEARQQRLALARADWEQAVANTPIDDAAWEQELAYRAKVDQEVP